MKTVLGGSLDGTRGSGKLLPTPTTRCWHPYLIWILLSQYLLEAQFSWICYDKKSDFGF